MPVSDPPMQPSPKALTAHVPPECATRRDALTYRNYLLGVLMVVLAFNYVDRMALGLLLQDIKIDLGLSDTQLGLLTGIAFALFYSVMGIPIARWADRGNRVTIIMLTTALWSGAVALCGLAASFTQLLLIRVLVAIGEAGCTPPAHSLIADYFSRAERPKAVSRYMLGAPLSLLIGYLLAGWLNDLYGWRVTFVLLGLPGIALAVLVKLTLREPRVVSGSAPSARSALEQTPSDSPAQPSIRAAFSTLWRIKTFRQLLMCFALMSLFGQGIAQWKPAFFVRSFGMQTHEVGVWFALVYGATGLLGTYLGGTWAGRYARDNEQLQLRAMAVAYLVFGLASVCIYTASTAPRALFFLAFATFGANLILGPMFASIQTLVPPNLRAVSIAVLYLFSNLIGVGIGPLAAGALSDVLRPLAGEESLRYALLGLCPGYAWVAWHFWSASKSVTEDVQNARVEVN